MFVITIYKNPNSSGWKSGFCAHILFQKIDFYFTRIEVATLATTILATLFTPFGFCNLKCNLSERDTKNQVLPWSSIAFATFINPAIFAPLK